MKQSDLLDQAVFVSLVIANGECCGVWQQLILQEDEKRLIFQLVNNCV